MDTSAQTPDTPATKAQARFSADHLRWVFAGRANIFDPRTYLQKILIEPAPERGVYLVASNAALLMVAYDAEGIASHRFTFDPLEEVAHICGFPDDGPDPFGRSCYADTIEIEGCTLTAFRTPPPPSSTQPPGARVKVLSQDVEIGEHFPPWQGFFTNLGTETAFTGFVDLQQLAIAFTGIPSGPMSISLTHYVREGDAALMQPVHIGFERLPLRAALMQTAPAPGEPPTTRQALPFDA